MAEVEIKVTMSGGQTQKELEKLLRSAREARKESRIGSDEFKKNATEEIRLKNQLHGLNLQAMGDAGKIKEAYFNSGSALRQFYMQQRVGDRTMRESAQTVKLFAGAFGIEGLTGGVEQAFGAFQQMEFATNSLGIAAQSAGGKTAELGKSLLAMVGPLAAAGAVGAAVGFIVSEFKRLNKELEESADKLLKLREELGEVSKLGRLNRQAAAAARATPEVGIWDQILGGIGMMIGDYEPMMSAAGKAVIDVDIQRRQAQLERERFFEEKYGMTITGTRGGTGGGGGGFPGARFGAIGKWGVSTGITAQGANIPGQLPGVAAKPMTWGQASPAKLAMEDLTQSERVFTSSMLNSVATIAMTIQQDVGKAWENVFGEANSLLEMFAKQLGQTLVGGFAQWGISSIISMIPGLGFIAPFIGGASSSAIGSVESTSGAGGLSGEIRGLRADMRRGVFKIQGGDLAMTVSRAEQVRSGMLIGG